jgi:hypothetical protein
LVAPWVTDVIVGSSCDAIVWILRRAVDVGLQRRVALAPQCSLCLCILLMHAHQ